MTGGMLLALGGVGFWVWAALCPRPSASLREVQFMERWRKRGYLPDGKGRPHNPYWDDE